MLTKTDLTQIREVVHEEVDRVVDEKLDIKLKPIREDLNKIGSVIDEKLDKKLKPIKKDLRYLKKTIDVLVDRTDIEDVALGQRVTKIEEHLQI